jgi:hypothetical protein
MIFATIRKLMQRTDRPRPSRVHVKRFSSNPIIRPGMLPTSDGDNINGPSLICAPAWLPRSLGELLYLSDQPTKLQFSFANYAEDFDRHIERSIRGYGNLIEDCVELSQYFIENDTVACGVRRFS